MLTDKQEGFLQCLISGDSQREAYKKNYSTKNMQDHVIDVKACQLLKNDKVAVRYNELKGKVIEKIAEEGLLNATDVLKGIADIIHDTKLNDPKTALKGYELYGKHLKLFTDKVEHSGNVDITHKSKLISKYLKGD